MKIIHMITRLILGGAQENTLLTCREQARLGHEVTLETAQACARQAALNALAVVAAEVGGLAKVSRIVRITGHVASAPGFTDQAKVLNAASELLAQAFGESGRHSRAALGAAELPLGAPVELEMIVEVRA